MKKEISKKLCLIKDIFLHGEDHANFGSKLDKRLAIISFHNAIELFLRHALNSKSIPNDELDILNFRNKIDEFEKRWLKDKIISNKAKIIDLNNLRNKIYHAYLEPRDEEVNEAKVITKLFLEEYTETIFDLDFNTISSFELEAIRNPFVKGAYMEAMELFEQGKYERSMRKFQHVFNEQWTSVYGTPIKVRTETNIYNVLNIKFYEDVARDVKTLADCVNEILRRTHVNKNHLYLKKWVDDIYHGYTTESVNLDDLKKIKRLVEEFIAETDDHILDEHLQQRIEDYRHMKRNKEQLNGFL